MNRIALWFMILLLPAVQACGQDAQVTVFVHDETSNAVQGASVSMGYARPRGWQGGGEEVSYDGTTDSNGVCVLTGQVECSRISIDVRKAGYYSSVSGYVEFTTITMGQLQPWNSLVDILLKPIGNPIAMYARNVQRRHLPTTGTSIGYDLIAGDLVAPLGKGVNSDFIFSINSVLDITTQNLQGTSSTLYDSSYMLSFQNDGDGIQPVFADPRIGSVLRLPREAPLDGYTTCIARREYCLNIDSPAVYDQNDNRNFFFRVRTQKDANGNIISALYGKIDRDFSFGRQGRISFAYYLNPTPNSRNMEFDIKKNLFTDLTSLERVTSP